MLFVTRWTAFLVWKAFLRLWSSLYQKYAVRLQTDIRFTAAIKTVCINKWSNKQTEEKYTRLILAFLSVFLKLHLNLTINFNNSSFCCLKLVFGYILAQWCNKHNWPGRLPRKMGKPSASKCVAFIELSIWYFMLYQIYMELEKINFFIVIPGNGWEN